MNQRGPVARIAQKGNCCLGPQIYEALACSGIASSFISKQTAALKQSRLRACEPSVIEMGDNGATIYAALL